MEILVDADLLVELVEEIRKVSAFKHCMSYNDSYFSEPPGALKSAVYQMERLINQLPPEARE